MQNTKWKTLAIVFFMSFYLNINVVSVSGADDFNDIENHWAEDKIEKWAEEGRISGYPDGSFKPDGNITKAEFITLINNLYGYSEVDSANFSDVGSEAWYANQTAIAKSNRYMEWYQKNQLEPDEAISREDVSVILAEILASKSSNPELVLESFEDGTMVEETHQSQVAALVEKGYLTGYPDGTYKPQGAITRAEIVNLLDKVLGRTITESGTVGNGSDVEVVEGNITVYKGDLTLTNVWIKGDLILTAEVAGGDINLENVTIDGRIIVDGGDSQIHLKESNVSEMLLLKKSGKSQVLSENSTVNKIILKSNVLLEGDFKNSEVEIQSSGHAVELNGTFASVEVKESASLEIKGDTSIEDLKVNAEAAGSNINTSSESTIKQVTFDGAAIIKGSVSISKVVLNANGVVVEPVVGEIEKKEATTDTEGVKVAQPSRSGGGSRTPDTTAPAGYSVSFDQSVANSLNQSSMSFTFSSAEVGTSYTYSIDDTNGLTPAVTGSGRIATATDQITGLDISGLDDDTLTLTVSLVDAAKNQGNNVSHTITKETVAPSGYSISIDQTAITASNETTMSFSFVAAEIGANYTYTIVDAYSGTSAVTGSGSIATATDQVIGINVSSLTNGTLTLQVKLTDAAGNEGVLAVDTIVKESTPPSGFSVSFDQDPVNSSNETAISFTFASAEVGTTYNYSIDDTNGATSAITGNGTIATSTDQISGIDVSNLDDDTLTLTVYLTDTYGNQGSNVTDTVIKDTTLPNGYSVSIDNTYINSTNETAMSFTFTSAEVGATYNYSIDDTNGATSAITGSGTIATATDQISGIDVSGLDDDTLTLTVYLTDSYENQGSNTTDTVTKETVVPSGYSVSFDQDPVTSANDTGVSFTFASAEVGTDYAYSISDGSNQVTGSGTIATATDQISGIDVSGLGDGTLNLSVTLTDTAGNEGTAATDSTTKEATPPVGYSVSFDQGWVISSNETSISFTFSSAEVGVAYNYSIDDTNGGTSAITGSGTIATATEQISGLDVSGLDDDTLTLTVYLTDTYGNQGNNVTDTVKKDTVVPSGYSVSIDSSYINSTNETEMSFTFASAEVGATYHYSIDDTNGTTPAVTGSGTIATATDQVSGLDVSGLDDDTLILTVYLTDSAGNQGSNTTDTVTKETLVPSGYTVSLDQDPVTSANDTALSFTFASAEVGTAYAYSISDGSSQVTGSGTIATATDQISVIDVSGLADGTLNLSVTLTDTAGNVGTVATDNTTKETTPPIGYSVSFDQGWVIPSNETSISFTFASAEVGATYNYSIDDTNGGTSAITGSGTIGTATEQISGLDVSGLDDDTLILTVYLTDTYGNQGNDATDMVVKDTSVPIGYSVSIDPSYINSTNATAMSFTFASAEVGTTYNYSIDDTNGATSVVTGSGTIATATDQISGIDVSGLDDDTLTLIVYLTDSSGNQGSNTTDTVTKETVLPSGYSVTFDQYPVTSANDSGVSFTFASAEVGTDYAYSISDGSSQVTGSGTIATTTDQISGIDVSGLSDGTLNLSVTLTDTAGNEGTAATDSTTKEATPPVGYSVSFDQGSVIASNETAISFTFASAEVGTTYIYSIDDSNGGTSAITGSGTIGTATDQINGLDVSSLDDDTLTLTVYLTDSYGNQGSDVTDTVTKDTIAPSGYSVSIDTSYINSTNATAMSFTFASAEVGADYYYSIDDTNGATSAIIGSGTIATATDQISGLDVSGLDDDTLILTVYLTDSYGNQGSNTTDTVTKETVVPSGYTVILDQNPVTSANDTGVSFTFVSAEVGTDYAYSISDGSSQVTGSGTITTATDQISGIDVSGLSDGTLNLSVTLTDTAGNVGTMATDSATKEATPPAGYGVSFDQSSVIASNETAISFTFASAEVGATYNYSIDDTNGGTSAITGSGTIATATNQINGLDVSSLDDDSLTLTVYLTDSYGNQGNNATDTITKSSIVPVSYTATCVSDPSDDYAQTYTYNGIVNGKPSYNYNYYHMAYEANFTILWDSGDNRWELQDDGVSAGSDPVVHFHSGTGYTPPIGHWINVYGFGDISLNSN